MTEASTSLTVTAAPRASHAMSVFSNDQAFVSAQRMCRALTTSNLVPENYRGETNMGNALIALDMANRMGISPLMVMQNLHVIEGRPSWASSFIISVLNSSGLFSPVRFKVEDLGEADASYDKWTGPKGAREKVSTKIRIRDRSFQAFAIEKATGEVLEGPVVTISMAVAEGWYGKPGSKWQTMPDLMGRYRAAAFFGRLYAPHILNGMHTDDEVLDLTPDDYMQAVEPVRAETAPEKPAGRPKGVHAALKNVRSAKPDKQEKTQQPASQEPAEKDSHDPDSAAEQESIDIFDSPEAEDEDDDYSPQ